MMTKKPMATPPIPVQPGTGSRWAGWQKPIRDVLDQLKAGVEGLGLRLQTHLSPGMPTCYRGRKVFAPETTSFLLDTAQDGVSSNPVNYVLRDGVTYSIPIWMPGDGVFVPDFMKVLFRQRVFVPAYGREVWVPGAPSHMQATWLGATTWPWTTKFSLFPVQPQVAFGTPVAQPCAVNFFWNMLDGRTGRKLADDWTSSVMLLPGAPMAQPADGVWMPATVDGGFFRFDCPWLFERDSNLEFQFRPTNPVLQFDSSLAGTDAAIGLSYDDRENGVRNQSVEVAVELHGHRYRTDQDAMRAGALTRY